MNGFWRAVRRIGLGTAFTVLFAAHLLLYYMMGTPRWLMVALAAALTETAVLAVLQLIADFRSRNRAR